MDKISRIKLSSSEIITETDGYIITFKINVKKIKFSELHLSQLFYYFYMVGRLIINYEGDKYHYYLSVKNPEIERLIRKWVQK